MQQCGLLVHQTIVWAKARGVVTPSSYMWAHEPCFYRWIEGQPPALKTPAREAGLDIDQQGELAGIHPTQKPVELFVRPIEYHTRRGTSSTSLSLGTQLIAAERTRRCSPQVGSVFRREGDASVRLGSKLPDFLDSDRARHY